MNYHSIKQSILLICLSIFSFSVVVAQPGQVAPQVQQQKVKIEIEEDELEDYIEALNELQEVQTEIQEEMMEIITEEGLDAATYNEIQRANALRKQNPEAEFKFEDDVIEKYNKAAAKVAEIQKEANSEMQSILQDSGIPLERFQEISLAMQNDADLQRRFREKMDKKD